MAGTPGRSGGHNKRSVAEHKYLGTFRPSRHGRPAEPPPILIATVDPPGHLSEPAAAAWRDVLPEAQLLTPLGGVLLELLAVHVAHARQLETRLQATAAAPNLALLRALRQESAMVKALAADFAREAGRVDTPILPEEFKEFDDDESPLDRLKRQARALQEPKPSKWAGMVP